MNQDGAFRQLVTFFKAARHLWGRCPACRQLFRLSDAAVSFGSEPPRDWLRKAQQQQAELAEKKGELDDWQGNIEQKEYDVQQREQAVLLRERKLYLEAQALAKEMLKHDPSVSQLLRKARQEAVQRSRSTLLGKLFERLAPFLRRFDHDPRDIRCVMDPIDYVCFDGLTTSRKVERITFVEVKVGSSVLTPTERSVMQAVREGRVATEVWQIGERGIPIAQQLLRESPTRNGASLIDPRGPKTR